MIARLPITVATCGSVNVDITAFCDRLPRPGETVTGERYTIALGGKGANQAAAVARLGARSIFVGRTGTDSFAALADAGSPSWASNWIIWPATRARRPASR